MNENLAEHYQVDGELVFPTDTPLAAAAAEHVKLVNEWINSTCNDDEHGDNQVLDEPWEHCPPKLELPNHMGCPNRQYLIDEVADIVAAALTHPMVTARVDSETLRKVFDAVFHPDDEEIAMQIINEHVAEHGAECEWAY